MIIVSLFTIWRTQACYNESTANESTVRSRQLPGEVQVMKKTRKKLTFAAVAAGAALAAGLTACHETVYGPPEVPQVQSGEAGTDNPSVEAAESMTAQPAFETPEDGSTVEPAVQEIIHGEQEQTEVIPEALYGPPPDSWFEDEYDPEQNMIEDVYGPPDGI